MATQYISVREAARKWDVTERTVQNFCRLGKVAGAQRFGRSWMVPVEAARPADRRRTEEKDVSLQPMPRRSPLLSMTDLYNTPGTAEKVSRSLRENPEARERFDAGIAYGRGQMDKVYEYAQHFLNNRHGFYAVLSAGMLLSFCAIWRGDFKLWREAKLHITRAPARNDAEREIISLILAAVDNTLLDYSTYPGWFQRGNFDLLPPDAHPAAKVFYAKHLYIAAYALAGKRYTLEGVQGLALMRMIHNTIEPMISQAVVDRTVIPEIRLRLWCAASYHNVGEDALAVPHIDRAIALALPDRLYGILAEHSRHMDKLLEERLTLADAEAAVIIRELYRQYAVGQATLSGKIRNRNVAANLTLREREIAKLIAFGFTNKQVAKKIDISETTVKTVVKNIMQKSGLESREDFVLIL